MWHESAKPYVEAGKVGVIGIIQEQHPDRARLFMQWQQMDWPLLSDPLNLLGISAVPITLLVDEYGVIRRRGAKPKDLEAFLRAKYSPPDQQQKISRNWITRLDEKFLQRQSPEDLDRIIPAYYKQLDGRAELRFRLGAIYRTRFDATAAKPNDFQNAVIQWQAALDLKPNHYIWRRRIQQFGPRLAKPYPFYDWVPTAREEILARGETPVPLITEPRGSEIAHPSKKFVTEAQADLRHPDPTGRLKRDTAGVIGCETVVVPPNPRPGDTVRIHLVMKPKNGDAVWNNEADPLTVFAGELPAAWQSSRRHFQAPMPKSAESAETRAAEFEIRIPRSAKPGRHDLGFQAFYYVCFKESGACTFLAREVSVRVDLAK